MTPAAGEHWIATPRGRLLAQVWAAPAPAADGAAIVLLHDSLGSVALWREFPQRLAAATGRTVVAYDRLGFGRSDPHPGPIARSFIRDEAEVTLPLVRSALGLGAVVPFGHSVGGGMAIAAAARHAWCAAVISESAQALMEDRTLAGVRAARADFARPERFERLVRHHGDKARWVLDSWTETWLAPDVAHWTLDAEARGVRCPALVLHGDRDEFGTVAHAERIAAHVAGPSRLALLDDCGHVPHREHTERVLAEVVGFLAAV